VAALSHFRVGTAIAPRTIVVSPDRHIAAGLHQLLAEAHDLCKQAAETELGEAETVALLRLYGAVTATRGSHLPFVVRMQEGSGIGFGAPGWRLAKAGELNLDRTLWAMRRANAVQGRAPSRPIDPMELISMEAT
jgi:hypothetical protein